MLQDTWECCVCFEEALGRDCVRMQGCSHVFCAECVGTHCLLHVREGTVGRLKCLAFKCNTELSHQVSCRVCLCDCVCVCGCGFGQVWE